MFTPINFIIYTQIIIENCKQERGKLMSRLSDWFGQEVSRHASKAATDVVMGPKDGASAYRLGGKILFGCGI